MNFKLVMLTAPNEVEAKRIGRALLANRLAVSVNLLRTTSLIGSSDVIDEMDEYLLFIRTMDDKLKDILKLIHAIHSSDAPDVILLDIVGGAKRFLERAVRLLSAPEDSEEM